MTGGAGDPFDLERFKAAQPATHDTACAELRAGRKLTHWIWWVFPQLAMLGRSPRAKFYGLSGAAEAAAYWADPLLRKRLEDAVDALLAAGVTDPHAILGSPDDEKVRSCLTLFLAVAPNDERLSRALRTMYGGKADQATLSYLGQEI